MTFTSNIPASGQTLGNSRLQVLNNFASLREAISNGSGSGSGQPNHVDVNNNTGQGAGKHVFVQMPVQTPGAANLPLANEGGMITQTVSGKSELFYVRDNVNTYYQFTGPSLNATNGYTVILGGVLIQWFRATAANGATITFPKAFSAPPYSIVGNEITNGGGNVPFDFVKPITGSTGTPNATFILNLITNNGTPQPNPQLINFIAIGPA